MAKHAVAVATSVALFVALSGLPVAAQWLQVGGDMDGEAAFDNYGRSLSLSSDGNRIVVGAYANDGNGNAAGHARIHEWNGASWSQLGIDIDGEAASDESGSSVSISGDGSRVAIGGRFNDGNGNASGHTRIYEWNGASWGQLGADIDGEAAGDLSGVSVSLSSDGSLVAIGAYGNDGSGFEAGQVRVYEWNGASWSQLGGDIDGEAGGDFSGAAVSLSPDGSRVAVGALFNAGNGADSGHVRVYEWNGASWGQLGADIDGEAADDQSGFSVSLSFDGSRVAVGAPYNDGNGADSGHVRVYEWNGASWGQLGADIDGEATGDNSGYSVSLSADGSLVAIGAIFAGITGHARIYEWSGSSWDQVGDDIDGESSGDSSGYSVSLSYDGSRVAIGAPGNDDNGSISGQARVYEFSAPATGICQPAPATCTEAAKSVLLVKNKSGKTKLLWKWIKGTIADKSELGDPTATNNYRLCIYSNGTLTGGTGDAGFEIAAGGLCDGKACWKETSKGFGYKNKSLNADGIKILKAKANGARSKVLVKGAPAAGILPSLGSLTAPVDVRIVQSDNANCYGATFELADEKKNDGELYKAVFKSP